MGKKSLDKPLSIEDSNFLEKITTLLQQKPSDKNILLTIPIWGWTGDGKTCALLTAIHYCDPAQHPLGLALVANSDELERLESSTEEYHGLNLASNAVATTARLRSLSETFIDNCDWPPGTDEPSLYTLAIRSINSTLGYVLFPDIKGGSFRELDETAKDVLTRAHAVLLLVNPEIYVKNATDGKRYRDEILARLQGFGEASIPVCVMITKADRYQGPNHAADEASKQLTIVLDHQQNLRALLCRVSVVGTSHEGGAIDKLPKAEDRKPDNLLKAWIWLLSQALSRTTTEIRKISPSVTFRTPGERAAQKFRVIPELRQLGHFSSSPGSILCASNDDARATAVTFVSESGELLETVLQTSAAQEPKFKTIGRILDWQQVDVLANYLAGEFIVGPRLKCNFVWHGTKGTDLKKFSFPYEMASWVPITARRIIGIDSAGRLHFLRFEGEEWHQSDYIEGFSNPTTFLTCAFQERTSHVFVFNGTSVDGVILDAEGKLGDRIAPETSIKFDSETTLTNRLGMCLAITSDGQARVSGSPKSVELGPVHPESGAPCAIAPHSGVIAITGPELQISAGVVVGSKLVKSAVEKSPVLEAAPQSMAWTNLGELLVISFEDKTWRLFRPMGLPA
jgi:hypothetical protein